MSPNLTVGYMAEQINRERLDGIASRGWLADEAAVTRFRAARPAHVPAMLGTALMRLGCAPRAVTDSTSIEAGGTAGTAEVAT